jgi:hypothetical protein
MFEKNGMVTGRSQCDFCETGRAEFVDQASPQVACSRCRSQLQQPLALNGLETETVKEEIYVQS